MSFKMLFWLLSLVNYSYSFGQVILSCDQASCIISDRGSEVMLQHAVISHVPTNIGDVSLGKC